VRFLPAASPSQIHKAIGAGLVSIIATSNNGPIAPILDYLTTVCAGIPLELTTSSAAVSDWVLASVLPSQVRVFPLDGISARIAQVAGTVSAGGSTPAFSPMLWHVGSDPLHLPRLPRRCRMAREVARLPYDNRTSAVVTDAITAGVNVSGSQVIPIIATPLRPSVLAGWSVGTQLLSDTTERSLHEGCIATLPTSATPRPLTRSAVKGRCRDASPDLSRDAAVSSPIAQWEVAIVRAVSCRGVSSLRWDARDCRRHPAVELARCIGGREGIVLLAWPPGHVERPHAELC
jgi:hypothetical protein